VYKGHLRRTRGRENLAALLTCIMVVMLVIVPCLLLLGLLARESLELYEWINHKVEAGLLDSDKLKRAVDLQKRLLPHVDLGQLELGKILTGLAGSLSGLLVNLSATALKMVTTTIWKFFLMLFALFYFLRDGAKFIRWVMHLSPLTRSLEEEILERFKGVSESAFYGTFLTALAQGFLGGIGFLIAGLQPMVWGVAMAFFSLIPVVGTAIVWGPAAIVLLLSGKTASGVFLIVWGIVVVGMSDNLLRPFLMKGKNELHPLLIFFSLLGGIAAFGLLGVIVGPLAIVLLIALLQAYEEAARPALDDFDTR
jgi:predicted PurR-regulated permease PerM